ncbi:MAG: adenylate/guanylate cyclase domain-containing protein [Spirochaetota bacterium]
MAKQKKRATVLETKYFGLIIGVIIVTLFYLLSMVIKLPILENIELKTLDVHFNFKNLFLQTSIQEGVSVEQRNPKISSDILIIGIDFKSLGTFGKWPFPRYRHATLIDGFSRISNLKERESALFIDVFFIEPDKNAFDDAILINSIKSNNRVFLETVLDELPPASNVEEEYFRRQEILYEGWGEIKNISGDWLNMEAFYGIEPPLQPYARAVFGYGHANFQKDEDKIYRRQALVAKLSRLVDTLKLDDLTTSTPVDSAGFERLAWTDKHGFNRSLPYPLTKELIEDLKKVMKARAPLKTVDTDNDGKVDESYYVIKKYKDHFVPSITLSLALNYFNKTLSDVEVILGKYILIKKPEYFDTTSGNWIPYSITVKPPVMDEKGEVLAPGTTKVVEEIKIPIDEQGNMLINFMGPRSFATAGARQTFPIRSYSGYAARIPGPDPKTWPRTRAVGNKILMVGPFAQGIAADEKPTPYGLMYGVEIHANSLNTILMQNFLVRVPWWADFFILFGLVMLTAFMTSRLSTILSLVISILVIFAFFIAVTLIFDEQALIINYSTPALGIFFVFLTVVVYRIMTEEKDKARIRDMFGKYVSPKVVDQILENPPELGGVDKELTVFFSDIRGFTTLSESMTPQELVNHLNLYLTAMTDIILSYQGTLDKYVGDEIMCFWGAPLPQSDHALMACKCALKQMATLNELNDGWPPEKRINIGIGLNSGIMTVGNMGSQGRMNYTLMGDNVNLGARLEGTNKQYLTNIILSEYTYGQVKDKIVVRELDNIRVKGKNKPVLIYELIDVIDGPDPPESIDGKKPGKK